MLDILYFYYTSLYSILDILHLYCADFFLLGIEYVCISTTDRAIVYFNVLDIYVFISLFSDETGSTEIFLEDVSPWPKVKRHSTPQSALQTNKMFVHVQRLA